MIKQFVLGVFLLSSYSFSYGQTQPATSPGTGVDKASAYYHYSLGHLYSELAGSYSNRGDYFAKAIENYKLALKEDPGISFVSEEISDLYIQSGRLREAVTEAEETLRQNPNDTNARRILARIYTRMIGDQQNKIDENMLKKAIEQYSKVVEKDPKDSDTWLMLGRLNKVAQNSSEAEKAYKKALELDPGNEDAMTGLAMVYADLGDTKSATDLLRQAADKNPSARSLAQLANGYEQMHEYGLAAETIKKAIEMGPPNASELNQALAQDLLLSDQLEESLSVYKKLVQENPKDVQSYLRMSQIYRQQRKFAESRAASEKAKEFDPSSVEIRYNEVSLLEAEGKQAEAIDMMKEIVASTVKKSYTQAEKQNRAVLLERLGGMYRQNEQFAPAAEAFRQIGEMDPDLAARSAAQVVDTYRLAKDYPKAQQESQAAMKKYPADRMVRVVNASLLADIGKTDEAAVETKKLLDGKNDRETYLSLAQIYEKGKHYDEMSKAIDAADKLSTTKEDKENVYFVRGAMFEKQKKFAEAEAEFEKVLRVNPNSAAALNYLGYMLADRNERLPDALKMITKAVEAEPFNGAYLDSLGWVYFRLNRLPEAEDQLKRSLERISRDPSVHDHLGDVYAKQGKLKEAIAQWQSSLREWEASAPADVEPTEVAKVQKKLEGARVRLAQEGSGTSPNKN